MPTSPAARAPHHLVLYVEDNPANLALVEQLLGRREDLTLISASTGERGLALARAHLPDMVLMDINLPDLNGIQMLTLLGQDPATAAIPVVALSSDAFPRQIEQGIAAGFYRYLTKPFVLATLFGAIDDALARPARAPTAAPAET